MKTSPEPHNLDLTTPFGISFNVYRSEEDGTVVVHVDTPDLPEDATGPMLRVYINDGVAVYENPPYPSP